MSVFQNGILLAENDNWSADTTKAANISAFGTTVGAFALESGSKDAAVLIPVSSGAISVVVEGVSGVSGIALIEIYVQ